MLVDEGKLRWDDRVIDHMPAFQMYDPYVTREMTIRDLLTHRSGLGLGAGDLMFWPATDFTQDEIIRRIRFLKPATSFRSRYAYDNLLYLVAGHIIPDVTGKSWEEFVQRAHLRAAGHGAHQREHERCSSPRRTSPRPHARADGKLVALEQTDHDNNAPAGAHQLLRGGSGEVDDRAIEPRRQALQRGAIEGDVVAPDHPADRGSRPALSRRCSRTSTPTGSAGGSAIIAAVKWSTIPGTLAGYVSRTTLIPESESWRRRADECRRGRSPSRRSRTRLSTLTSGLLRSIGWLRRIVRAAGCGIEGRAVCSASAT